MKSAVTKISLILFTSIVLSGCYVVPNRQIWPEPEPTSAEASTSEEPGSSSVDPTSDSGTSQDQPSSSSSTSTPDPTSSSSTPTPVTEYCAVKFYNGESVIKSFQIEKGTNIREESIPEAPVKSGYSFVGWSLANGGTPVSLTNYTVNVDTSFYAKFELDEVFYQVHFYVDGLQVKEVEKKEGSTITSADMPDDPSKSGYNFVGWSTSDSVMDIVNPLGRVVNSYLFFYAWFEEQQASYTVTFMVDGVQKASFSVTSGSCVASNQMPTTPSKDGYTFAGWSTSSSSRNIVTVTSYPILANTTFYGWFDKNTTYYTVTFYNEGAVVKTSQVEEGQKLTSNQLPSETPSKSGYTFVGWSVGSSNPSVVSFSTYVINENTDFYAYFTKNTAYYTVTFYIDGSTSSIQVAEGQSVSSSQIPSVPGKTGYTFSGWSKTYGGSIVDVTSITINSDTTFYAVYSANLYTVRFYNGSEVIGTASVYYGNYINSSDIPSVTVPSGKTFKGWGSSSTATSVIDLNSEKIYSDRNLYAVFEDVPVTYSVKFYDDSIQLGSAISVEAGGYLSSSDIPSAPTKAGYTFKGWTLTNGSTTTVTPTSIAINSDKNFYTYYEVSSSSGDFDGYYDSISDSLSGTSLKTALNTLNSSKRSKTIGYSSMRNYFKYTEVVDGVPSGKMYGFYDSALVSNSWDNQATWNHEHVWPNSRGAGNKGSLSSPYIEADIHMVRPASVSLNSERGNLVYASSGAYDPGQYVAEYRGVAARIILYCAIADTRLGLVDDLDSSNSEKKNMGKLSDLLAWNLQYLPSTSSTANLALRIEQNRNEQIYSRSDLQGNRNPFIDHPEYACRIWGSTNATTKSICGIS